MNEIPIGEIIKEEAKRQNVKNAELARMIGTTPNNMGLILRRSDIHTSYLRKLSKVLNRNFFECYCQKPNKTTHLKVEAWIDKEEIKKAIKDKLL